MSDITIREATIEDTVLIGNFIRALAAYEKLEHEAVATDDDIRDKLFGEKPQAEVIIAEDAGTAVGFALYFHNFSTFLGKQGLYLEDLYVNEVARGKGAGKKMLAHLADVAVSRGCGRMEWWVLDWNTPSIDFYRSLGADAMEDWTVFRLRGDALIKLAAEND